MARILFCLGDEVLETALLRLGHTIRRATLPRGALAVVNLWQFRRAAAAFRPDFLLAGAGDAMAADTARQIGARYATPPGDEAFLADHWLSPPFLATPAWPAILYCGMAPMDITGAEAAVLTGDKVPPVIPEIAALAGAEPRLLAGLLGGGAVVVGPDTLAMRCYIADGVTGDLHPAGDADALAALLRGLVEDPGRRVRMAAAARGAFLARHRAATQALRDVFGSA